MVIEHELPSHEQLHEIARGIATEDGELPEGADMTKVLDAASGLTRYEAEGAFSLSLVRHGKLAPDAVWELKSQTLKKSGLLSLYKGGERFADLGGLEALKSFCLRACNPHPGRSNRGDCCCWAFLAVANRRCAKRLATRRAGRRSSWMSAP